ncbi:MAG: signal recognition particle receptor subunit alpha, partial [Candidatus Hydrothermarchaeaceae archaeon]
MALEKLSESLTNVIKKITFAGMVDEKLVKEVVKDIQRALLSADVNVKLVMNLSKAIEERALKEKPKAGVSRREHVIKIVYEELVSLLGERRALKAEKNAKIMLVGLQGSGKTTTAVKLAKFYMKRGMKPFIIAGDTFRPAAYEQILQLAEPLGIGVYGDPSSSSISVLKKGMDSSKGSTIVLLDTAGRHKSEKELFDEMRKLSEIFKPDEKILVVDSNVGQQAGAQARAFHEAIGITGVILTKVDGSAKGGGALSAVAETSSPILFIGTGEKIDDFELFDPDRFISRLIGMGDLATLLEKAKETVDEDEAKKIMKGDLTFLDLQSQIKALMK